MADKEPRRRKKNRRDSQKKDDVRSEDQFFATPKCEPRDSDQEVEEEIVIHSSHQPSNVAQFVFVILFSGLVVSLSVIFISLKGVDEGPVDIFDVSHDNHHSEAIHDEHIEDALHSDHDDHEESEVSFEDILPSLSSILSLNNEQIKETENPIIHSEGTEEVTEDKETEDVRSYFVEPESLTDQGILEEYVEDTSEPDNVEEPVTSEVYPDTTTSIPYTEDESLYSFDYPETEDFATTSAQPDEVELTPEPFSETTSIYDDVPPAVDVNVFDDDNDQDDFSLYERIDITNEADFEMRDQLDEIDNMVEKESNDEEDEDEDEDQDEAVEEEFDFWQF